jgi:hypothetical protein
MQQRRVLGCLGLFLCALAALAGVIVVHECPLLLDVFDHDGPGVVCLMVHGRQGGARFAEVNL